MYPFGEVWPRDKPPRSNIEKLITRLTVVSQVQQTCWTAVDRVWCEKLATAWSVTASVVNYLYFAVIDDRHVGIYASRVNWRSCLVFYRLWNSLPVDVQSAPSLTTFLHN